MTPEAAIARCPKCSTWVVGLAGKTLCQCVISSVHPQHRNRLQRLHGLLSDQRTMCDRCDSNPAFRVTQCYEGCYHAQCWGCADQTKAERLDELQYDKTS